MLALTHGTCGTLYGAFGLYMPIPTRHCHRLDKLVAASQLIPILWFADLWRCLPLVDDVLLGHIFLSPCATLHCLHLCGHCAVQYLRAAGP